VLLTVRTAIVASVVFALAAVPAMSGALTIDDWVLGVLVDTSPGDAHETRLFSQPSSPFELSHEATVAPSTSSASYNIEYSQTFGQFLIESSQTALGGPFGTSATAKAAGTIWLTADAPIAVSVDASYTYDLPPVSMFAQLRFVVRLLDDPEVIFLGGSQSDDSWTGEGAAGTLTMDDSTILPAGLTYMIQYNMKVTTFGGPQNAIGTGDGYIDFTLQAVPEPATAILLLCALPLLRHRRRERQ